MSRIRTVKPEFWGDEKLAPMPPVTRLIFLGLISMADDGGRLVDSEKQIEAFIFPFGDYAREVRESLALLAESSRVVRGTTQSGQAIIQITNWARHQKVDHPNLKAMLPEVICIAQPTAIREGDESNSRTARASTSIPVPVPTTGTADQRAVPVSTSSSAEAELRKSLVGYPDAVRVVETWAGTGGMAFARWAAIRRFGPGGTQESADVTWEDVAVGILGAPGLLKEGQSLSDNLIAGCIRNASQNRRQGLLPPRGRTNGPRGARFSYLTAPDPQEGA